MNMSDQDKRKVICCTGIGFFILFLGVYEMTFTFNVLFDNGFDDQFDIIIDGAKSGSIAPRSIENIMVKPGDHKIAIRKQNGELFEANDITLSAGYPFSPEREGSKFIYNIGRKYIYFQEICEYTLKGGTRDVEWDKKILGDETFIKHFTDYNISEGCPKKIYSQSVYQTVTKLTRKITDEKGWYRSSKDGSLDVGKSLLIDFTYTKKFNRTFIEAGCKDGETMDGIIEYWNENKWVELTTFSNASCDYHFDFNPVETNKFKLTMTAGGGRDSHIGLRWKVHAMEN